MSGKKFPYGKGESVLVKGENQWKDFMVVNCFACSKNSKKDSALKIGQTMESRYKVRETRIMKGHVGCCKNFIFYLALDRMSLKGFVKTGDTS